jgi:hypothetical protein
MISNNKLSDDNLLLVDKCIEKRIKSIREKYLTFEELNLLQNLHHIFRNLDI